LGYIDHINGLILLVSVKGKQKDVVIAVSTNDLTALFSFIHKERGELWNFFWSQITYLNRFIFSFDSNKWFFCFVSDVII